MTTANINEIAARWATRLIKEPPVDYITVEFAIRLAICEAINILLSENTQAALDNLRAAGQPKSAQQPHWLDEKPMVEALGCTVLEER